MPVKDCQLSGRKGKKCGDSGKCYTGRSAYEKAVAQCAVQHIPPSQRRKKR